MDDDKRERAATDRGNLISTAALQARPALTLEGASDPSGR